MYPPPSLLKSSFLGRSRQCDFNNLPLELITYIFVILCLWGNDAVAVRERIASLRLVCRSFNIIAEGTAPLWSTIHYHTNEKILNLCTWIKLSKGAPLDICLDLRSSRRRNRPSPALSTIIPLLPRCRRLDLRLHRADDFLLLTSPSFRHAPLLEELSITGYSSVSEAFNYPTSSPLLPTLNAPRLMFVSTRRVAVTFSTWSLNQLERLHMHAFPPNTAFLEVLREQTQLKELQIGVRAPLVGTPVVLPALRSVIIVGGSTESVRSVFMMIQGDRITRLHLRELSCEAEAIQGYPTVTDVEFRYVELFTDEEHGNPWEVVSRAMPLVASLCVDSPDFNATVADSVGAQNLSFPTLRYVAFWDAVMAEEAVYIAVKRAANGNPLEEIHGTFISMNVRLGKWLGRTRTRLVPRSIDNGYELGHDGRGGSSRRLALN